MIGSGISKRDSDVSAVSCKHYENGVSVLWSEIASSQTLVEQLAREASERQYAHAIIWFSLKRHSADDLVALLAEQLPELPFTGCSTSGEVTPSGMQNHGIVVVMLPAKWFQVSSLVLEHVASMGMETIARQTSEFKSRFLNDLSQQDAPHNLFAFSLIDGLSYSEETVTLAMDRGLDGIPLVGGSAGDDLQFEKTWQITNGTVRFDAALLTLCHCNLPFQLFTNNNFVPTEHKLVVTDADPDKRRVNEFNAEPAAIAYANAIGMHPDDLDAGSFASYSVVVRFGGQYYCRSIQQLNDDLSLTFFCAIDNGMVMTVARSEGMVASSKQAIDTIEDAIGPIDIMFGFDCIYRRLDAQHRQTTHRISRLYRDRHFVGFNTYGEQYNSLHINQTFTGVAIGKPGADPLHSKQV